MKRELFRPGAVPIISVVIRQEEDVVAARQRARQLASVIGFNTSDQVRIATAVSEITRNAFQYGGGRIDFALDRSPLPQELLIRVSDHGPGIADLESVLSGQHRSVGGLGIGLTGTRRLMDTFEIQSKPGQGTTVSFSKRLPPDSPRQDAAAIATLVSRLTQERLPEIDEPRMQTRDLLDALDALRLREMELEKRNAEMRRINSELEETNRGVVALYAELDEKAVALQSADELKSRFLSHVSHEFRTPLNSILALTQMLIRRTDGDLSGEQERQVGYIRRAAQDLTEMVNDLLDLAKVEAGKTELHLAPIHLGQLFGTLRGVMRPLVVSDSVTLVFDDPPETLTLVSDESKVAQVLRNLISNALKFTERGEVRVSFAEEPEWLSITVSDTGIGIAPEDQERIFQEFAQVNSAIQSRVKGTGLGLPLSRKLAGLLGGRVSVESRPGEGSRFTLMLPIVPETSDARVEPDIGSILIIDDEEAARYIVRQSLRGTQRRLIEATGGVEGAERARFERPDLIFLDLVMPDRSGFEVLEELKNDPATRAIPVVIHTSRQLNAVDLERLGNRQVAILPKGDLWPPESLLYISQLLGEPGLFGSLTGRVESGKGG